MHCDDRYKSIVSQQTQNICITFVQRRPNVFDVGPTLYKCYTNILCQLGYVLYVLTGCGETVIRTGVCRAAPSTQVITKLTSMDFCDTSIYSVFKPCV